MDQCYGVTCSIKTPDLLVAKFPDTFTHLAAMKIMQVRACPLSVCSVSLHRMGECMSVVRVQCVFVLYV